ncbi:oligosaccharide flippase family protein [Priestia flexa]|nr:oligosaccharide flippase family protein [Priestia flexa]
MSIAKNYLYNVVYQVINLLIPLITVPYVARALGADGVGINAYTNSIMQYFILFGTIGISLYGNRAIAYVRDNKEALSRTFFGILILKFITTGLAYLVFLLFLNNWSNYQSIFLLQSIYILAATIDISWLYMGLEDFKKTVIRNLMVKIVGVACIFIFVHDYGDLWKYVLILALSQLLGNLSLWMYLPKTIQKVKITWNDIKGHFMPSISLFIPQIAIQIYVVMNKIMLGYLANTSEVGLFDSSEKIIKMTLAVVTAMGVVMLPRMANTFAKGEIEKVKNYLYQSFDFASYLSFPMMFGLAGIANEFAPWFFKYGFEKTALLIFSISPILVFIAWSNVLVPTISYAGRKS